MLLSLYHRLVQMVVLRNGSVSAWVPFLSSGLVHQDATPQRYSRQDQSTKRIGSQDQGIDPDPRGIQGKVMERVLQHHDGVIDGKHAGDQLLDRCKKGDRPKGPAQKELNVCMRTAS